MTDPADLAARIAAADRALFAALAAAGFRDCPPDCSCRGKARS